MQAHRIANSSRSIQGELCKKTTRQNYEIPRTSTPANFETFKKLVFPKIGLDQVHIGSFLPKNQVLISWRDTRF